MKKKSFLFTMVLVLSLMLSSIGTPLLSFAKEEAGVVQEENQETSEQAADEDSLEGEMESDAETPGNKDEENTLDENLPKDGSETEDVVRETEETSETDTNELDQMALDNKDALADDVYYIRTALSNSMVLDIQTGATDEDNVQLYTSNKDETQKFQVIHDEKGYVSFINAKSGKALAIQEETSVLVCQEPNNDSISQKWIAQKSGAYHIIISALDAGLMWEVKEGNAKRGTKVQTSEKAGDNRNNFQFISCNPKIEAGEEVISNGVYYIHPSSATNYSLDISDGSTVAKANVQIYKSNKTVAQAFEFKYDQGYYTIKNVGSGKMIDVANGGYMPTTNVWQYTANNSKAQKWKVQMNEDGSYTFISIHNGMALDVSGGKIASGKNIQVYTPNNTPAQQFRLERADKFEEILPSGDYYILSKKDTGYGLDIKGGSEASKANVQLYKANKTIAQAFQLQYSNGSYMIRNLYSNKVLDAQGGKTASGTNVWQYNKNGTPAQRWHIQKNNDGSYTFLNQKSGKALDVYKGKIASGNNVWLYNSNNSDAQKFILKNAADCYQGVYSMQSVASTSKVMDVRSGSVSNKAYVQLYNNNSTEAQKWAIRRDGNVYNIISGKSGKALDICDGDIEAGTKLWQYNYNGTDAQQWKIVNLGDGSFKIASAKDENLVIGISGKVANKSNLTLQKWTNAKTQKWKFKKATCKNTVVHLSFSEGSEYVIQKGRTSKLHIKEVCTSGYGGVTYSSSNSDVLSVDSTGNIKAKRAGNVTVIAKSKVNKNITAKIKVYISEEKGEINKKQLDDLKLTGYDKLMIVAHPDDETFWGGGHLLEDNYLVVCITNGWNNTRRKEFQNAMKFSKDKAIILDYPDLSDGQKDNWKHCKSAIIQDIQLLIGYKDWKQIVTHNPDGEYGHVHHKMLDRLVTQTCKEQEKYEQLYYFGIFWNEIPKDVVSNLKPQTLLEKRKMTLKYTTQYSAYKKYWIWMEPYEYWIKATRWNS